MGKVGGTLPGPRPRCRALLPSLPSRFLASSLGRGRELVLFCNKPWFSLQQTPVHATGRHRHGSRRRQPRCMPRHCTQHRRQGVRCHPRCPNSCHRQPRHLEAHKSSALGRRVTSHRSPFAQLPSLGIKSERARPCRLSSRCGGDATVAGATPTQARKTPLGLGAPAHRVLLYKRARRRSNRAPLGVICHGTGRCRPATSPKQSKGRRFSASQVLHKPQAPQRAAPRSLVRPRRTPPWQRNPAREREGQAGFVSLLLLTNGRPSSITHTRSTRPHPHRTHAAGVAATAQHRCF